MIIEDQYHFLTLSQGHLHVTIKVAFLTYYHTNFKAFFQSKLVGIHQHNVCHKTKTFVMLIYDKTIKKSSLHGLVFMMFQAYSIYCEFERL